MLDREQNCEQETVRETPTFSDLGRRLQIGDDRLQFEKYRKIRLQFGTRVTTIPGSVRHRTTRDGKRMSRWARGKTVSKNLSRKRRLSPPWAGVSKLETVVFKLETRQIGDRLWRNRLTELCTCGGSRLQQHDRGDVLGSLHATPDS
jgi:hypothetical protein